MNSSKSLNAISASLKEELKRTTGFNGTSNMNSCDDMPIKFGSDLDKFRKHQLNENTKETMGLLSNEFNLEVNTFNDPNTINASPLSSSSSSTVSSSASPSSASLSSSSTSSLLASFTNLQKISNNEFESILNANELSFEIDLRKLSSLLDKLNWSLKSIANDSQIEIDSFLNAFLNVNNTGQHFIIFENAYIECNGCKLNLNLNKIVKKLKNMFEIFLLNNANEYGNLDLNLVVNKSILFLINLIINYKHECSNNNSNMFIIQIMMKKFLKNLDSHLNRKKLPTINKNLAIVNYNSGNNINSNGIFDKSLMVLDQLDNNNLKTDNSALNVYVSNPSPLSNNNSLRQSIPKSNTHSTFSSMSNAFNKKILSNKKRFRYTGTSNSSNNTLSARNENNNLILKAINKRKLQLSCTMCSSKVLNMSDHLLKKHSIRDRNMRKNLMDQVKDIYLSKQEHSTIEFTKKLTNELDLNEPTPSASSLTKISGKSDVKKKNFSEQKQHEAANSNSLSQQQQQILLNQQRKMIKCPICTDENKYFVNISDHFIKIHHLNTSEMRKPFLKKIKEDSRFSTFNIDQVQSITSEFSSSIAENTTGLIIEKQSNQNSPYLANSMENKKINKRKASKTKKIRQQQEIDIENLSNLMLKKETHSISTSDITNATNIENDLIKKVFDLYDLNQYLSENNPNSMGLSSSDMNGNDNISNENKNDNETGQNLIYDSIEFYKELLNKSSGGDDSEKALKQNEVIELIIDLENNRYPSGDNILKNGSQDLDQEIKTIFNKRKPLPLAPRKHENIDEELENDSSSFNNLNSDMQESNNEYTMSKKAKFHLMENFNSYNSMTTHSPSTSPTSPLGPRISGRSYFLNKPPVSITEINPVHFGDDHMNANYHLNELNKQSELECRNQQDEKESSFDSLDIEFDNIVPDNNNQNIINENCNTEVAETVLNNLEDVQSLSLVNTTNTSKHSKQIHMNVDSSVKSSCPSSSPEGGSSTNYNPNQIYYNNYSSNANHSNGNSLNLNSMQYTNGLYDRFTNLEMKLNSTIDFLTSFTSTFIKQLENTRNEIKTLKNELLDVGNDRNNSNSINFNHHESNHNSNGDNHLTQHENGLSNNMNSNILLEEMEHNDNNHNSDQMGNYGDYNNLDEQSYNYNNRDHQSNEISE